MTHFIQLHLLTAYGPANLNRDDTGRPKTAMLGGVERARISSQSLKRAWRTSAQFESALGEHIGTRTRLLGKEIYGLLCQYGMDAKPAFDAAAKIAAQFGKLKQDKNPKDPLTNLEIEQLVHLGINEYQQSKQLAEILAAEQRAPTEDELKSLRKSAHAVDIALFGRMLADYTNHNVEAACQVAHAIGTSATTVESDFFTALDDLGSELSEHAGSAHMGDHEFTSALFYTYICISHPLLLANLQGDHALLQRTLRALTETITTVAPTGKQNSFASRAYASYVLAEQGPQQPRSLITAFFKPIRGENQLTQAIERLTTQRQKFEQSYGPCADRHYILDVEQNQGNLTELSTFVSQ